MSPLKSHSQKLSPNGLNLPSKPSIFFFSVSKLGVFCLFVLFGFGFGFFWGAWFARG